MIELYGEGYLKSEPVQVRDYSDGHYKWVSKRRLKTANARVWTTIYAATCGCLHLEWGHEKGPELSFDTIKRLSKNMLGKKVDGHELEAIQIICSSSYGARAYSKYWVMFYNQQRKDKHYGHTEIKTDK